MVIYQIELNMEVMLVKINNNTITTTLGTLANTGILAVSDVNSDGGKVVLDPRDTKKNMSACQITITKVKSNIKR